MTSVSEVRPFGVLVGDDRRSAEFDARNSAVRLFGLTAAEFGASADCRLLLERESEQSGFTKLTVYAPPGQDRLWRRLGLRREARIRGWFRYYLDAHLWCRYGSLERERYEDRGRHDRILDAARRGRGVAVPPAEGRASHAAVKHDAAGVADLLRSGARESTPDVAELEHRLAEGTLHARLLRDGSGYVIAAACAEIDVERRTAAVRDCARVPGDVVDPGAVVGLLRGLESDLARRHGIRDLHALVPAEEAEHNAAWAALGYACTGRLVNERRTGSGWSSLNVWSSR
jgi:hypothetical protein